MSRPRIFSTPDPSIAVRSVETRPSLRSICCRSSVALPLSRSTCDLCDGLILHFASLGRLYGAHVVGRGLVDRTFTAIIDVISHIFLYLFTGRAPRNVWGCEMALSCDGFSGFSSSRNVTSLLILIVTVIHIARFHVQLVQPVDKCPMRVATMGTMRRLLRVPLVVRCRRTA
jgi:hypothetical protein